MLLIPESCSDLSADAGSQPVSAMLEAAQPLLTRITGSPALQANASVISALCEVRLTCVPCTLYCMQPLCTWLSHVQLHEFVTWKFEFVTWKFCSCEVIMHVTLVYTNQPFPLCFTRFAGLHAA